MKNKKGLLVVSWKKYIELSMKLLRKVRRSGEEFDMVISIARGGNILGLFLSFGLGDIPLATMAAQSYNKHSQEETIIFSRHLAMTTKKIGRRCILVDDLVDSGRTLKESTDFLKKKYGGKIEKLSTAVIFQKPYSDFQPDFVTKKIGKVWVVFPYESLVPK